MTTKKKTRVSLPESEAKTLQQLRKTEPVQFYAHIIALRERGWPLRAIGEPFDVTRVAVSNWEKKAYDSEEAILASRSVTVPELPINGHGSKSRAAKIVPDVPPADQARIARLAPLAAKNTRWSDPKSPERLAAQELNELFAYYHLYRKVPAAALARYAGVSRRSVMQRLNK